MLDKERADRIEDKIDQLQGAIAELKTMLATEAMKQMYLEREVKDLAPLKGEMAQVKGMAKLSSGLAVFVTTLTGVLLLFKK